MHLLAVLLLAVAPVDPIPADGLGLAPGPQPLPVGAAPTSRPAPWTFPLGWGGLATAIGGLAAGVDGRRRVRLRRSGPVDTGVPGDMLFVFVPGNGSDATGTFEDLQLQMGLGPHQIRTFDYRWLDPDERHTTVSRMAHIDDVGDALTAFLAGIERGGRPVYLIGHSKGGVAIAEVLARWDRNPDRGLPGVVGAALLDPPMASGIHGLLQGFGWSHALGLIPSNGGYHPVECRWFRCRDRRKHLGETAGVDVVVIRNPDAVVTNFNDRPEGLRVLDLVDDGGSSALRSWWFPLRAIGRVGEAHESVLHHPAVAACLVAEARALGSCEWEGDASRRIRFKPWGRGRGFGPVVR